ncbi:MAG: hypothetical protein H6Q76_285 [Firmicutes bacterium]|nr:hypothetical protein [Bacillota bacterium]
MIIRKTALFLLLFALIILGGCDSLPVKLSDTARITGGKTDSEKNSSIAGLQELPPGEKNEWNLQEHLLTEGTPVRSRIVTGSGLLAPQAVELSAGVGARTEYFLDMDAADDELKYRFQFLSTQGTGRMSIAAVAKDGRTVATVGYVFTGSMPDKKEGAVWIDRRLPNNYQGDWVQAQVRPSELFSTQISSFVPEAIARYRVSIESGNGQHALITELKSAGSEVEGTKIVWRSVPPKALQGETVTVVSDVTNVSDRTLEGLVVRLHEPYGYGLVVVGNAEQKIPRLAVGETASLSWEIKAQRASAVNFRQPWSLQLSVNKTLATAAARIDVTDPAPGKVFYVMTEDLEPMDAAGYPTAWGNQNGWLDAEEFRVQLVDKAEALNRIAEKHGAFWTHYLAMPAMEAGEWAAKLSTKSAWRTSLDQVRASVRAESKRGHEYALHLHSDYDPEVPGNVLSYDPTTDGFWANHMRHGWAHSFPTEGDPNQRGTRTGILFHHLKELTKLTVSYPTGEILTSRTGSFDFGNGPESEAMSIRAYRAAGLWGNTDADGNEGGITSGDYSKSVYLTPDDDINAAATDFAKLGLVEFRPTPRQLIMYDIDTAATMNEKVRQGVNEFTEGGKVRAGVYSIAGFSHAMFIMGSQGWKSTVGKQFQALDDHLGFLKREFVQKGLLQFGTATALVREYLDYYWPVPLVLTGPLLKESSAGMEFALDFLGRNIPVDSNHQHNLHLKIPLRYWGSGLHATLLKNGQPLQELLLSGGLHEIAFVWGDRQDQYRLVVGQRIAGKAPVSGKNLLERLPVPAGQAPPLPPQPDNLLRKDNQPNFR